LSRATEGLFDWVQPTLPEDLHILRTGGNPWLVTISRKEDGYFELSKEEKRLLVEEVPSLALSTGS
jgi:hypothetical protein